MIASTSQPGRVPNVPRFGNLVSSPSRSSERMASRTGWRLTPKRWARSTSRIRSPGASRPPRTSARSASAMSWRSERSRAGSTTIAGREPHGQSLRLVHPCIPWSLFVRPGGATAWHPRSGRPRFGSTISTPFRLRRSQPNWRNTRRPHSGDSRQFPEAPPVWAWPIRIRVRPRSAGTRPVPHQARSNDLSAQVC
jgi:hypothetical protein